MESSNDIINDIVVTAVAMAIVFGVQRLTYFYVKNLYERHMAGKGIWLSTVKPLGFLNLDALSGMLETKLRREMGGELIAAFVVYRGICLLLWVTAAMFLVSVFSLLWVNKLDAI